MGPGRTWLLCLVFVIVIDSTEAESRADMP